MNSNETIEAAKNGSQKAFTKLYNAYHKTVYNCIYNIVKNTDVADDLLSETFLKAFKNINKFVENISFEMWLKTIANHHSIDFIRSTNRNRNDVYIDDEQMSEFIYTDNSNPEKDMIKKEEYKQFENALKGLGDRSREVLTYRYQKGLSYREIAEKLNLNIGTIKHYIHRYKKVLISNINQLK